MEFDNLIKLIRTVSESGLDEFKYEAAGVKLRLTKGKYCSQNSRDQGAGRELFQAGEVMQSMTETEQISPARPVQEQPAGTAPSEKAVTVVDTAAAAEQGKETEPFGNLVVSPLVGTFYTAPSEDAKPFVSVGDTVKKGQTLAIIEAMKLMNEIESEYDGTITEILVNNAEPVEYGQPLFRIS